MMKQFEWDDLQVFLAIYRGRSVRAASHLLGVSHSTISRRLHAMEQQLNIKMFLRQPEGFVLTQLGEAMIERAERIESEILSLEREVFGTDTKLSGPIRISAPPPIAQSLLMPILAEFVNLYPEITVEVNSTFNIADLQRRSADIAIRFQSNPNEGLTSHRLPEFASAVYATPAYIADHTFTGQNPTGQWIGWGEEEILSTWRRETPFSECRVRHHVADSMAQLDAVKTNLGFSFFFCFLADLEPELIRIPDEEVKRMSNAWVLTHPDLVATERVRVCVRYIVDAMNERESQISGFSTS